MNISASALTAQRFRMDVITENIANSNTTRTEDGTPYQRRYTIFQQREATSSFSQMLNEAKGVTVKDTDFIPNKTRSAHIDFTNTMLEYNSSPVGGGVRVSGVGVDTSPFKLDYNPTHPDADEDGYVRMPNVDTVREMTDMMEATRAYEANITAFNASKSMLIKALDIGK